MQVLRDWRGAGQDIEEGDAPIVHPDGLPIMTFHNAYGTFDVQVGLKGNRRTVSIELEGDELRVRLYADDSLTEEPAGEMRLSGGAVKVRYGTEFDT